MLAEVAQQSGSRTKRGISAWETDAAIGEDAHACLFHRYYRGRLAQINVELHGEKVLVAPGLAFSA